MEAIIVGISFLGVGTIIQREREARVEGLTTAASVLMAAAIWLGQILLGTAVAALVLFVNRALFVVERWLGPLDYHQENKRVRREYIAGAPGMMPGALILVEELLGLDSNQQPSG